MPSASPEYHSKAKSKKHHRRSRSRSRSPVIRKSHSNHRDKKYDDSDNVGHHSQHQSTSGHRKHTHNRSRERRSESREKHKIRTKHRTSPHRSDKPTSHSVSQNRDRQERSRFERVRVKEEPLSEDEDERRRRRLRRTEFKREPNDDNQADEPKDEAKPKEKPNFELSGKLAEDTNVFNGVVVKYNEPTEARKPKKRWRLYAFKGDKELPMLPIHRQSAYLLGRERRVADIPIDHPSCSKQHAALQYRSLPYEREDGTTGKKIRPYIIDLESANGTYVNNQKIEPRRYVELMEKDVIKFGYSTREYVLLHEGSSTIDDEVNEEEDGTEDQEEDDTENQEGTDSQEATTKQETEEQS